MLIIVLIEYIPISRASMSILIVFVPQVLVFSLLCTCIYRRTGTVYTGAFTVSAMAAWIITGGSAIL